MSSPTCLIFQSKRDERLSAMDIVKSKNDVPIRLTEERWLHIVENHDDLAGYYDEVLSCVEDPDFIIKGYKDALVALKKVDNKFLAVVYKELSKEDGFIITAYFTSKIKLEEEVIVWQKKS
jgi:hypothetical protein